MKSLEELTPEEKIDILANYIRYLLAAQAGMVMPLVEKYGDEAKDYLKRSLRLKFKERFKRIFDDENGIFVKEWVRDDLSSIERLYRMHSFLDAKARLKTDKPEIMCEIDAEIAFAMAEAINPKLKYTKYSGDKIKGKTDWGLPYGKPYCEFIVELED
ncbi:MAG: hypothetical protein QXG01_05095 [Candidatus Bathyarchaeia archaeon]